MFTTDVYNNLEPLSIYLAKPSGTIICCLDKDINIDDSRLIVGLNQQLELQFSVINDYTNENTSYDALQEGMYLFVEKIGLFKMKQPTIENDGIKETKNIIAYSCEVELEDKNCALSLNMGTSTSQEYLVTYDTNETENLVNPYTNIPYDWLVIYNTFPEQLSKMASKYSSGYYGSKNSNGEIVIRNISLINELQEMFDLIPRLKSKITQTTDLNGIINSTLIEYVTFTYDSSGENVTIITLLSNFLSRINALITFYTKYRSQLSLLSVVLEATDGSWSVGDIYGVSEGDYSLANRKYQFESDETIYSFLTHTLAEASNCIVSFDILNRKVNMTPVDKIGNDTGIVLSYENLVNTLNISCNDETLATRLYVNGGNDLSIRQVNFGLDYIDDITYKLNAKDGNGKRIYVSDELAMKYTQYIAYRESQRASYIQYSKDYRYYDELISELKYRVPNDSLKTDWGTFSYEELEASLATYKNLLAALVTLYKNDYGTAGVNSDGSVNENYIKNTMYWYDYEAYKNTIIEIECACHTYPYYSDQSKWTSTDLAQYKEAIKAWETDWTLYGTIELQAKIDVYTADMKILAEQSVIPVSSGSDTIKKWDQLTSEEKESFGNLESNYFYDTYMNYYNNRQLAKAYLATLQSTIDSYERNKTICQNNRLSIVNDITLSNYFTDEECKQINLLYRDSSYSNENILTTSIDSSSESIDRMCELLEDSKEKLSSLCRPQLTFNINSDNILGLVEFKPFWNHFIPGNYILVQYKDDVYVKLRMIGFQFNPCLPSSKDFSITFSNYIRSKTMVSDLENLLGLSASRGTDGSSRSPSSSGDTYGESDDIDVTISNTMLAKLMNSEMFGTRVTNIILDTVDVNSITARYAKFEGLAKGTTLIDGKCITTGYIIDQTYNGTNGSIDNTSGSVLNLETGYFNFGGGHLKWNGSDLNVSGALNATSLSTGGKTGGNVRNNGIYIDSGGNLYAGSNNETIIYSDGTFNFGDGKLTYDGTSFKMASYENGSYVELLDGSINIKESANSNINIATFDSDGIDINDKDTGAKLSYYGQDGISIYDGTTNNIRILNLYKDGLHIYRNGVSVGKIGSNEFADNPNRIGLVFDLDYTAQYIAWCSKRQSTDDGYFTRFAYYNDEDKFEVSSPFYFHDYFRLNDMFRGESKSDSGGFESTGTAYMEATNDCFIRSTTGNAYVVSADKEAFIKGQTKAGVEAHGYRGTAYIYAENGPVYMHGYSESYISVSGYKKFSCMEHSNISYQDLYMNNNYIRSIKGLSSYDNYLRIDSRLLSTSNGLSFCVTVGDNTKHILDLNQSGTVFYTTAAINGDLYLYGNFYNYSDIRLKKNIKDTEINSLSLLSKLKLKQFDWIEDDKREIIGFIAQQVYNIMPDLVNIDENTDRYSIKIDKFIPYLVKAIQELYDLYNSIINEETFDGSDYISDSKVSKSCLRSAVKNDSEDCGFEDYTMEEKMEFIERLNKFKNNMFSQHDIKNEKENSTKQDNLNERNDNDGASK